MGAGLLQMRLLGSAGFAEAFTKLRLCGTDKHSRTESRLQSFGVSAWYATSDSQVRLPADVRTDKTTSKATTKGAYTFFPSFAVQQYPTAQVSLQHNMTTTMTVASPNTTNYISARSETALQSGWQTGQEPSNLVVLPSSNYLRSNISVIRDVKTLGPELTRSFTRIATQIIAQGKLIVISQ